MPLLSQALVRFPRHNWLLPVAPPSDSVPAGVDRILGEAALAARAGDDFARDALFAAFRPRLDRSIRRAQLIWSGQSRRSTEDAVEPSDIEQEAYLVFVGLIKSWTPGDSFSAHVAGHFPWRMQNVLRRWRRQRGPRTLRSAAHVVDTRNPVEEAEIAALIEKLAATAKLDPPAAVVFRRRLLADQTFETIAEETGLNLRSVRRRWQTALRQIDVGSLPRMGE